MILLLECFKKELTDENSPLLKPFLNKQYKALLPASGKIIDINPKEFAPFLENVDHYLDIALILC